MKTSIKIFLFVIIAIIGFGCESNNPPTGVPGLESVFGVVTNENGELLEGISIEAYYDKETTKCYPEDDQETVYTDKNGCYSIRNIARFGVETLTVYVVAIDTTGIYEKQLQEGQIKYSTITWENDRQDVGGAVKVNFVLKK